MPKFLGVASKSGFFVFLLCLVANGAGAGVLDDFVFGGYISVKAVIETSQSEVPKMDLLLDSEL